MNIFDAYIDDAESSVKTSLSEFTDNETYISFTKDAIRNVIKESLVNFTGMSVTEETKDQMRDTLISTLNKYIPAGVSINDLLEEIELDRMTDKLNKLGFNNE